MLQVQTCSGKAQVKVLDKEETTSTKANSDQIQWLKTKEVRTGPGSEGIDKETRITRMLTSSLASHECTREQ